MGYNGLETRPSTNKAFVNSEQENASVCSSNDSGGICTWRGFWISVIEFSFFFVIYEQQKQKVYLLHEAECVALLILKFTDFLEMWYKYKAIWCHENLIICFKFPITGRNMADAGTSRLEQTLAPLNVGSSNDAYARNIQTFEKICNICRLIRLHKAK
jgi:hypothetical protein